MQVSEEKSTPKSVVVSYIILDAILAILSGALVAGSVISLYFQTYLQNEFSWDRALFIYGGCFFGFFAAMLMLSLYVKGPEKKRSDLKNVIICAIIAIISSAGGYGWYLAWIAKMVNIIMGTAILLVALEMGESETKSLLKRS